MSIYSTLFKYPSTRERTQLENFATEPFADLMNRVTNSDAAIALTLRAGPISETHKSGRSHKCK